MRLKPDGSYKSNAAIILDIIEESKAVERCSSMTDWQKIKWKNDALARIEELLSAKGLEVVEKKPDPFSDMLNAIESLLPQHSMACIAHPDPQTAPWTFYKDSLGNPLITPESCKCSGRDKAARVLLAAHRQSSKGFSPS